MTTTPDHVWATARRVCTPAELEVLITREHLRNAGQPHGHRSVAEHLGISFTTARDRSQRAWARIERELAKS